MQKLPIVLAASLMSAAPIATAQIPTTDAAAIAAQGIEHLETLDQWRTQYDQMVEQITALERQLEALTGSRDLGEVMQNPLVRRYLPREWQEVYHRIRRGGYGGLTGRALEIAEANRVFDACAAVEDDDERLSCEARAVKPAQDQAYALDAYALAEERLAQIDGLMSLINSTEDPKGIAELQARIAVEQTNIDHEAVKLQLYAMAAEAEDRIAEQRQREIDAKLWSSDETTPLEPITFGAPD